MDGKRGNILNQIILSGGRPTGALHLGHYVGAIKKLAEIQTKGESYFVISDLHMLTTRCIKSEICKIRTNAIKMMVDCMGAGILLDKTLFYLQSNIPELPYLYVLIQNLISVTRASSTPSLQMMSTSISKEDIPLGLLAYPVLEAADIISMQADKVVVGRDNIDHVSITQEIIERINAGFSAGIKTPQCITDTNNFIVGLDGRCKMSNSLNNAIFLTDAESDIDDKITRALWYPATQKNYTNAVMQYLSIFDTDTESVNRLFEGYYSNESIEAEAKERAKEVINSILKPIRENIAVYSEDTVYVEKKLKEGTQRAREIICKTLKKLKNYMGLYTMR